MVQAISDWMLGLGWNQKVTRDHASTCKKRKKSFYNSRDTEPTAGPQVILSHLWSRSCSLLVRPAGSQQDQQGSESDPTMMAVQRTSHK